MDALRIGTYRQGIQNGIIFYEVLIPDDNEERGVNAMIRSITPEENPDKVGGSLANAALGPVKNEHAGIGLVTSQATQARLGLGSKKAQLGLSSLAKRAEL